MKALKTLVLAWMTCMILTPSTAQDMPTPVSYTTTYSYDDTGRLTGVDMTEQVSIRYAYDESGRLLEIEQTAFSGVDVESDDSALPSQLELSAIYPNPFSTSAQTTIALPEAAHVSLGLYDVLGRNVARLIDQSLPAGIHGLTIDAASLPSGVYVLALRVNEKRQSRIVSVVK